MKRLFLAIALLVFIGLLFLVANLYEKREINKNNIAYDNINKLLLHYINNQKMQSLSIALALSKDSAIADAILQGKSTKAHLILNSATSSFSEHLNRSYIFAQIYKKPLVVFANSWNGVKISRENVSDRDDLQEIIKTNKPLTSIESTMPVGIKASVPIGRDLHMVGILEVTTLLDEIVSVLREYGVETIVLIDQKRLDERSPYSANPLLFGYRVASDSYNRQHLATLASLGESSFEKLLHTDYLKDSVSFFAAHDIKNSHGIIIGYFITVVNHDSFNAFAGQQKSLLKSIFTMESTAEDIYHHVNSKSENIFEIMSAEQILRKNSLPDEKDYIYYNEAIQQELHRLSKDELINLILKNYYTKEKRGEIR